MDDESPSPVVPEEKEPPPTTVLDRMRAKVLGSFDGKSDDEIIASLHLSKQDYRSAGELELQRRFVCHHFTFAELIIYFAGSDQGDLAV